MNKFRDIQLNKLSERAKELQCIYRVIDILREEDKELEEAFRQILEVIPPGWQFPTICEAMITFEGKEYRGADFTQTPWMLLAEIIIDNHVAGSIQVCYSQNIEDRSNPFLPEEQRLLNTIAERISLFIFVQRLKKTMTMISDDKPLKGKTSGASLLDFETDEHWKWRLQASERIAEAMDFKLYGVQALYLIGSTKDGTAGPSSDIDLLVHFRGDEGQKQLLISWLKGWGHGLAELNYLKSGYRVEGGLVDAHFITDEDIRKKTSYAVMIGSSENSAWLLKS